MKMNVNSIYRLQLTLLKKRNKVLCQKPFTLKGLYGSTVRPLLTANRSIYSGHHLDQGFEKEQAILTDKMRGGHQVFKSINVNS